MVLKIEPVLKLAVQCAYRDSASQRVLRSASEGHQRSALLRVFVRESEFAESIQRLAVEPEMPKAKLKARTDQVGVFMNLSEFMEA